MGEKKTQTKSPRKSLDNPVNLLFMCFCSLPNFGKNCKGFCYSTQRLAEKSSFAIKFVPVQNASTIAGHKSPVKYS